MQNQRNRRSVLRILLMDTGVRDWVYRKAWRQFFFSRKIFMGVVFRFRFVFDKRRYLCFEAAVGVGNDKKGDVQILRGRTEKWILN